MRSVRARLLFRLPLQPYNASQGSEVSPNKAKFNNSAKLNQHILRFAADAQSAGQLVAEEVRLPVNLQLQGTLEGRAHHQAEAFARLQAQFAKVTEFVRVVRMYAADDVIALDFHIRQRIIDDARHHAIGAGDRFAVGAAFGVAAHFVHFVDQDIADDQTHVIGIIVDFVPAESHDIDEEALHQPMPPDIGERLALSRFGQADAAVRFVIKETGLFQSLYHARDGGRRNMHFFG